MLYIYLEWLCRGLLEIVEALRTSTPLGISLMAAQASLGAISPVIHTVPAI